MSKFLWALVALLSLGGCDFVLEYHRAYNHAINNAEFNARLKASGYDVRSYGGYPAPVVVIVDTGW